MSKKRDRRLRFRHLPEMKRVSFCLWRHQIAALRERSRITGTPMACLIRMAVEATISDSTVRAFYGADEAGLREAVRQGLLVPKRRRR